MKADEAEVAVPLSKSDIYALTKARLTDLVEAAEEAMGEFENGTRDNFSDAIDRLDECERFARSARKFLALYMNAA